MNTLRTIVRRFREALSPMLFGIVTFAVIAVLFLAFVFFGFKFAVSTAALSMVSVIMFFRCNDLGWRSGMFWMKRRIGFILVGVMPLAMLYSHAVRGGEHLTAFDTMFHVGLALVFMTTPYLPPFWTWVSKGHDTDTPPDARGMPHRRRSTDLKEGIT